MKTIRIIGAGGITGYFLPAYNRVFGVTSVTEGLTAIATCIQDGDTLEERNIDRQLFDARYIGRFKAAALNLTCKSKHKIDTSYYSGTPITEDAVLVFVDNDRCRRDVLRMVDERFAVSGFSTTVIFAANETNDAIAYVYRPEWRGTRADPRVRYPEINTNDEGHPFNCTSPEHLAVAPQTATANARAAAHALWLLTMWKDIGKDCAGACYEIFQSKYKTETTHHAR